MIFFVFLHQNFDLRNTTSKVFQKNVTCKQQVAKNRNSIFHLGLYCRCFLLILFTPGTSLTLGISHKMPLDDWPEAWLAFCQRYQAIVVAKFVAEADDFWYAPVRRGNVFKKESQNSTWDEYNLNWL